MRNKLTTLNNPKKSLLPIALLASPLAAAQKSGGENTIKAKTRDTNVTVSVRQK